MVRLVLENIETACHEKGEIKDSRKPGKKRKFNCVVENEIGNI